MTEHVLLFTASLQQEDMKIMMEEMELGKTKDDVSRMNIFAFSSGI
jgi:hypothetical protein